MSQRKRTRKEREIDGQTARDTLRSANIKSAVISYPKKSKRVPLNMRLDPELIELSKQIAALKHLDGYTQLIRLYICEGVEKDKKLLTKARKGIGTPISNFKSRY